MQSSTTDRSRPPRVRRAPSRSVNLNIRIRRDERAALRREFASEQTLNRDLVFSEWVRRRILKEAA